MTRTSSTNSVEKVCAVLRAVASTGAMRLVDIADRAELNKSTTLRILRDLIAEDFIRREGDSFIYELGPEFIAAGAASSQWQRLLAESHESLERLARESGDTASLALRSGRSLTFVGKAVGPFRVQVGLLIGARVPMPYAGIGVAMLALLSESEREWVMEDMVPPEGFNGRQVTRAQVEADIEEAERNGYSYLNGRLMDEVASASVAISFRGTPVAGLAISSVTSRLQPRAEEVSALLIREAKLLQSRIEEG